MSDKNQVQLGKLCNEFAGRDAVHVAVIPMTAGEDLDPGDHVTVNLTTMEAFLPKWKRGLVSIPLEPEKKTVGVVDPFLRDPVLKGERFYLCLYPNTITSLRHVWTSEFFKPQPLTTTDNRAVAERNEP